MHPLPPERLRDAVRETIRRHWVVAKATETPSPVPAADVDKVARATLDTMLTRQYRVGPLPSQEIYDQLLKQVHINVRRNKPILIRIGYGPLKNQKAVSYSRADWAEFFALCHLTAWHNKVQAVYAPGLIIRIIFDDTTLVMANQVDRGLIKSYIASVAELIKRLGFERVFLPPVCQSRFSWFFRLGLFQIAGWRVRRWERNPANKEQLDRMNEFAHRNVLAPPGLSESEQDRYVLEAAHRYRVYWEALQLSGFTNSKDKVVAMYLDGTQHHIQQKVALHLTTLDKGQVTQPWQGQGTLLDNGRGKLEPFVLTAGRRARYQTHTVEGLDLVPMPGFDRLDVCWPCETPSEPTPPAPDQPAVTEPKS